MKKLGWALGSATALFFAASLLMAAQYSIKGFNLVIFDANNDGRLDSSGPSWNVLYLVKWEGRGRTDKKIFPIKGTTVKSISTKVLKFVRADGSAGWIKLDAVGLILEGGFYLALDTTAIRNYGFEIRTPKGELLNGIRPIQGGWRIKLPSGKEFILT
ncbi:MAG: hypothetical protein A3J27_08595 [Candidatus Tectomicrobia bacterium RIFCSPLOWO2_12_FULL_69_37]|nr:MAG: hypothetical protein A3I72_14630 [Candidatus Tectomicrobia bacterium RIFCSPLOWO2_02_FULL_70_19]OGL69590.1 MAG: hypothetical protein A3J27_08595 [Candidatus Tectomicrobia bacterium RIFCSPLOWO2_12_FULL_69_37]